MLNHCVVQGRLVADPELRSTQSDVAVCSFRVAWSEKYKENEKKLFLNCTAWRGLGEMVSRNFYKGKEIVVEGKLSTRDWEDQNGNKRQSVEMTVERVHFCGPKGDERSDSDAPAPAEQFTEVDVDDGELLF